MTDRLDNTAPGPLTRTEFAIVLAVIVILVAIISSTLVLVRRDSGPSRALPGLDSAFHVSPPPVALAGPLPDTLKSNLTRDLPIGAGFGDWIGNPSSRPDPGLLPLNTNSPVETLDLLGGATAAPASPTVPPPNQFAPLRSALSHPPISKSKTERIKRLLARN